MAVSETKSHEVMMNWRKFFKILVPQSQLQLVLSEKEFRRIVLCSYFFRHLPGKGVNGGCIHSHVSCLHLFTISQTF